MTPVFADAFYFLALINPRDVAHARAVEFSEKHEAPVLTTAWVLTEVADALSRPPGRSIVSALLQDLERDASFTILPPLPLLFRQGLELYCSRLDKSWSLTDCISFVAMRQHGLTESLTGDRHFEQVGFRALLLP
ncbi:MAG: PIN domain-containing protein [Candidatus Sumerlaeota bacterium]|nr:PIN domain-containing protein [Candidatus Sumerlaeota bacterium]